MHPQGSAENRCFQMVMICLKSPLWLSFHFINHESLQDLAFLQYAPLKFIFQQQSNALRICRGSLPKPSYYQFITSPSLMTMLSPITAPAATRLPDSTLACLTVAPIETYAPSSIYDPWIVEFGPISTLLPILTFREI